MAPETLTIGTCSIKSDAWSLGCLAHFLSHGRPLFCGDREEVLRQIFEGVDCLSSVNYSHKKVRFADNERINENSTDDELASSYIGALLEAGKYG